MEPITVPDWFISGKSFKCLWIPEMDAEVISFDVITNLLKVKLTPNENAESYRQAFTEDGWNLQHTLIGFDKGDYIHM